MTIMLARVPVLAIIPRVEYAANGDKPLKWYDTAVVETWPKEEKFSYIFDRMKERHAWRDHQPDAILNP